MPGVFRPATLIDVLSVLNDQGTLTDTSNVVTGLGSFAEADETVPFTASATGTVAAPATWDNGVWGATQWH